MDEIQEAIKEFLVESHENLEQLDTDFVMLEKDPGDVQTLGSIFRTIHTLKGSAGLLGYERLQRLAHAGEGLLSRLRDRTIALTPETTSALLTLVDAVRQMLRSIEAAGHDGAHDYADLIEALTVLREGRDLAAGAAAGHKHPSSPSSIPMSRTSFIDMQAITDVDDSAELGMAVNLPAQGAPIAPVAPRAAGAQPPEESAVSTPVESGARQPATTSLQPPSSVPSLPAAAATPPGSVADSTIRIDVGLLDKLMTLVSELVLTRNQLLQVGAVLGHAGLANSTRQLNLITSELQEEVMRTRMQPIGNIWGKFPRMVRDMALACGKRVELEMEGSETALDKSIIEAVRDPLTHLVRNAVDHGIESPERRRAAGKPTEGRLFLRAFHEGGQVNIEISDDGVGIDTQRIRQKAVQRSLITLEQATLMSDQSALNLVFLPGFSTADRVTSYSGRGVGMDVVKTNIEKIGGSIDISSRLGEGTSVKMRIPLTLAIIRALLVTSAGDRFAIPQVSMIELVRLAGDETRTGIERLHDVPVYRYRGKLLPLVFLNRVLGMNRLRGPASGSDESETDRREGTAEVVNIIVLEADDRRFGLVVDGVTDTQEIVVKPLARQLKGIGCFAGATIMGDGKVALILDVLGLAQRAGILATVRELALAQAAAPAAAAANDRQSFLLVRGDSSPMAIPLEAVARIEKIQRRSLEYVGGRRVVQYRGEILPLIDVAGVLRRLHADDQPAAAPRGERESDGDSIQLVVYSERGRSVGLIVDRILDILEQPVAVRGRPTRDHVLYTAVVGDQVTEVLNVASVIRAADPAFFDATTVTSIGPDA
jgi:two-component system chemotaxis sensor kinase CheA